MIGYQIKVTKITKDMRDADAFRYDGTCSFPGCARRSHVYYDIGHQAGRLCSKHASALRDQVNAAGGAK